MTNKYPHLHPNLVPTMDLDVGMRIEQLKKPRWIGYPRAQQVLDKLEDLLIHPKEPRMPGILLVGPSNNGKTKLIRMFTKRHPVDENIKGNSINAPVLYVQAPPTPSESAFYSQILTTLFERIPASSADVKREKVIHVLREIGTKVLIIDELHNILAGASVKQQQFLNMIKYLSNELEICIVGCGTGDLLRAVSVDPQIQNRFTPELLPLWAMGKPYKQLLASFEMVLPLKEASNLATEPLASQILALSEGTIGEASILINMAAEYALKSGEEKITSEGLKKSGYIPPEDRKKVAARI